MRTDKAIHQIRNLYKMLARDFFLRQKGVNDRLVPINTHGSDKKMLGKHVQGQENQKLYTLQVQRSSHIYENNRLPREEE